MNKWTGGFFCHILEIPQITTFYTLFFPLYSSIIWCQKRSKIELLILPLPPRYGRIKISPCRLRFRPYFSDQNNQELSKISSFLFIIYIHFLSHFEITPFEHKLYPLFPFVQVDKFVSKKVQK